MNHLTAESSVARPTFRSASEDVLSGRLPLMCDLSRKEFERARADCALVVVDFTLPHCLAIVVLRRRHMHVVGSYQADAPFEVSGPDDLVWVPPSLSATLEDAPIHELLRRVSAVMHGAIVESILPVMERQGSLALLKAFNREAMAA